MVLLVVRVYEEGRFEQICKKIVSSYLIKSWK